MAPSRLGRRRYTRFALAFSLVLVLLLWLNPNWTDTTVHHVSRLDPREVDLTNPAAVQGLCRLHGWKPFRHAAKRKVYDLVMVNTELEWLEIRMNGTYDYVDYFVIVESSKTFTNRDKPLFIKDNMDRFAAYRDKIIYHLLEIPDGFHSDRANPAWDWEDLQRNAMYDQVLPRLTGAQAPVDGDVLIVADVDELVRPETVLVLKGCEFPRRLTLRSHFYYYSYQFMHKGTQWAHPQATYYQGWRTILPTNLRNSDGGLQPLIRLETGNLWSAGWHCSTCFSTIDEVLTKMSSFSHQWMNHDRFRDRDRIADRVRSGKDLWDREGELYERVEANKDVPELLLREPDRFPWLLNRDGPTAGFQDYEGK